MLKANDVSLTSFKTSVFNSSVVIGSVYFVKSVVAPGVQSGRACEYFCVKLISVFLKTDLVGTLHYKYVMGCSSGIRWSNSFNK